MSDYVRVASLSEVPAGGLHRVIVGYTLICLANVDGDVYAINDDCTHIGGSLSEGELEGCVVTCPVHLARFDVRDGRVLRGPARDDAETYPVRVEDDAIYVALTPGS